MTGKTEKHLDSATYKNYYVHVFRLLSGNEFDGTPCDYGEHGSVVAAGVASLKLLINFETEAAVVHAVAEDPLLDNKHRRSCLASGRSLAPPPLSLRRRPHRRSSHHWCWSSLSVLLAFVVIPQDRLNKGTRSYLAPSLVSEWGLVAKRAMSPQPNGSCFHLEPLGAL